MSLMPVTLKLCFDSHSKCSSVGFHESKLDGVDFSSNRPDYDI